MERVINSFAEYQHEAGETMKPETDLRMAVLHCTMGMVGEAGEFAELSEDEVSSKKGEVGDCMWYAANLATAMGWDLEDIVKEAQANKISHVSIREVYESDAGVSAMLWAARLNDHVKKVVFYNRTMDDSLIHNALVSYVAWCLLMSVEVQEASLDLLDKNIKKLRARFGGGVFDAHKAIQRDYKAESEASGLEIQ